MESNERRCTIRVTRTHKDLVKRLFEMEVPEVFDGTVWIRFLPERAAIRPICRVSSRVLRRPPSRTNVDPVGACIGQQQSRVTNVTRELSGEKVDIVEYSEDPAEFIAHALAPSDVVRGADKVKAAERCAQASGCPVHSLA